MKKDYFKWFLDLLMLVFLITFVKAKMISLSYHEIGGLIIGAVFVIHIVLNWQWVKNIAKVLFSSKLKARNKLMFWFNVLIFISMLTIIITGLFISEILFPGLRVEGFAMRPLHEGMSYLALTLVGLHIGLNGRWLISVFKKIFSIIQIRPGINYVLRAVAAAILIFGIFSAVQTDFYGKVPAMVSTYAAIYSGDLNGAGPIPYGLGEGLHKRGGLPPGKFKGEGRGGEGQQQPLPGGLHRGQPGSGKGDFRGRHGQEGQPNQLFYMIITYLSIIGSIAIVTYYADKILARKKG